MSATFVRILTAVLFFLFIFALGFWLSRSGKPYNIIIFTIHKLIAMGAIVYLAVTVHKVSQVSPLDSAQIIAIIITLLCFLTTILTGGLVSLARPMPPIVTSLHHLGPWLAVLSTVVSLYLFRSTNAGIIGFN
ncbi:MAG TPA: hypothetical protein VGK00_03455 [Anaerolineales bacterium]|jgi:hypothetical protein